ncbi:hypothetical protein DFA_00228 [Cavenderia fasciculata]|uniref:Uncharacterized protein n=1 Tax=Cavenderia fasciculata TaxID=261658 RepID=F4PXZ0_CACFS|nr:uncharacterized protein DFA_00228 [Cavenderia fasciculata]EGG19650.1 hypothetical protein DFA_00228 [Cavenderia fasciculata]|eukprot:XP_004357944.1 hypothetical protein DFA_00228 [Cavenderia fasciculata]
MGDSYNNNNNNNHHLRTLHQSNKSGYQSQRQRSLIQDETVKILVIDDILYKCRFKLTKGSSKKPPIQSAFVQRLINQLVVYLLKTDDCFNAQNHIVCVTKYVHRRAPSSFVVSTKTDDDSLKCANKYTFVIHIVESYLLDSYHIGGYELEQQQQQTCPQL